MRIIAGELKGRRLAPVKGRIRPTAAKGREAVFSILGTAVFGARVLDLFAGTGALGIEALSRGAAAAVFVEDHPESLKVLCRNLADLGLADRTTVWPLPVTTALKQLAGRGEPFGLAFLDPPYGGGDMVAALSTLASLHLLRPGARVVVEHSRRESLPEACGALTRLTVRRYGDTQVAFYLMAELAPQEHD
jgi:16S rRNA (guanine966-N2)-methyltransferase